MKDYSYRAPEDRDFKYPPMETGAELHIWGEGSTAEVTIVITRDGEALSFTLHPAQVEKIIQGLPEWWHASFDELLGSVA